MQKKIIYRLIGMMLLVCAFAFEMKAQQATWIWYPGDFEIWLGNQVQNRRTERGSFFPPFWKLENHYVLMDFHKDFDLAAPEQVSIAVEGNYTIKLDGKAFPGTPALISVPAGKHRLSIKVFNQSAVPSVYVKGNKIISDASWLVTYEDKEWIDETGKASDQSGTTWLTAGSGNFNEASMPPSTYRLPTDPVSSVKTIRNAQSIVADFGKETFGFIKLHGVKGNGKLNIYYGESSAEALDTAYCETLDNLMIKSTGAIDSIMPLSKAFRYVNVRFDQGVSIDSVSMLYEYAPVQERGSFRCSDEQINRIYDVAKYTFRLNTREFFIDGIKRDRWVWSGDAYQSYLMNYYLYFDEPTVTRTMLALRGKDPVTSHINTIMDYTFYWFLGIYDYYQYTGNQHFIKQFYPRMVSLMDYVLSRRNADGLLEGLAGDWVFIDWAEGLSKKGAVSFEQLLFARSLETMALCAGLVKDDKRQQEYERLSNELRSKLFSLYWNENKQALVHSRVNGAQTENVTRYANMFAIFFNYFNESQKQGVKKHVLLNDNIQKITTPYMRFYELEALCAMGEQPYVLKEMKAYWGGMLNLGATSFWEEYNPSKKGDEHLAMYGRPYGKSLCHAWGASPVYLLGKYYLGVKPTAPGYSTYVVEPSLGGLQWMEGQVPTPDGTIDLYCSDKQIKIKAASGTGLLRFSSKSKPTSKEGSIQAAGGNKYEMSIEKGKQYVVNYKSPL
ncbi:MAG: alpha-rhamnosidase [Chitinophagaceae bacterium]